MTQSLTLARFKRDVYTTMAGLVACQLPTPDADARSGWCNVPGPTEVSGRPTATGTPAPPSGRAGADDFEITVTLRVDGAHVEDVVAHSFANPYCVDIQVQSPTVAQRTAEAGRVLQPDDQASRRARSKERPRLEAQALLPAPAPLYNEWDEV